MPAAVAILNFVILICFIFVSKIGVVMLKPKDFKFDDESFLIEGGRALKGTVVASGGKNAVLPLMAASLLAEGETVIEGVPDLMDVRTMSSVISHLGAQVFYEEKNKTMRILFRGFTTHEAPYEFVTKMRASVYVMAPLLAVMGKAKIALPGGCAIGVRPVNFHLEGFRALGSRINVEHGYIEASVKKLKGTRIVFPWKSVGATINIMIASVLASGETLIENAASEPEVVETARFLKAMGAEIEGEGTETIKITGVKTLNPVRWKVMPDRIEVGTFAILGAMDGNDIKVENARADHLTAALLKLEEAGAEVDAGESFIRVKGKNLRGVEVETLPYPGFPTDLQAPIMAALTRAKGTSIITETIFENRFLHVGELLRFGADITVKGRTAIIKGVKKLYGAEVTCPDLRGGAALVMAALIAEGESLVHDIYHIDRGYEKFEEKLSSLGARIERVKEFRTRD